MGSPDERGVVSNPFVMNCSTVLRAPSNTQGLHFRFKDGSSSLAEFDTERQYWVGTAPKGSDVTKEEVELVYPSGEVACAHDQGCDVWKGSKEEGPPGNGTNYEGCASVLAISGNGEQEPPPVSAKSVFKQMSFLDQYLAVWIIMAMVVGVVCGYYVPHIQEKLSIVSIQGTSLPIAIGLWLMMWPVLAKVRYELLGQMLSTRDLRRQLAASIVLNWIVGPLLMTGLAWATLPDLPNYRNGVIMVGLARCIAMVLLWNQLAGGSSEFCAILVAVNSVLQIVLFSPLALFYLQVVSRQYLGDGDTLHISFWLVCRSVLIFLGAPLVAAILTRYIGIAIKGRDCYDTKFAPRIGPIALLALLYTVWVLFALQGHEVIKHIGDVCRVAVPMFLYFSSMWVGTLLMAKAYSVSYERAVTQAFTASSNNFELAIAVSVATFGVQSAEALAATVGPLIEVPVLLSLVYVALWLQKKFQWK
ncbi:Arsenical-resistance protein Acr3 [Coccomyxa sp. Obi]|nr:Arsenical-resistance protein Acr3 [Coccomyxa sp. Obi]